MRTIIIRIHYFKKRNKDRSINNDRRDSLVDDQETNNLKSDALVDLIYV